MYPSCDVFLQHRTHPLINQKNKSILILAASSNPVSSQSSLKILSSQSQRTIQRTCCLFISYLFSFPFPMSRFCTFLLWFFTHLSFKSGELIKDRRSLPVFQHPKPRQRVKAFRPKSIYGAPRQAASAYTQPCCCQSCRRLL